MRKPGRTPGFRERDGRVVPGSIAEAAYFQLGGVPQWVLVRGRSLTNPPLILLHGGPGMSEMAFFRCYNAALEESFTVVNWDQRGAGKSFDPSIPASSMTVAQLISDLDELVDLVRRRLDQPKVVILGHSWGTILGSLYTARFPEKVSAYVGTGQLGDWRAAERATYEWALAEAKRQGRRRAVRELLAIGAPPYTEAALWVQRNWLARLEGGMSPRSLARMARMVLSVPESSAFELPRIFRALRWSMQAMWPQVSRLNLLEAAPEMKVPVFFLLGRNDHWAAPQHALDYFNALRAPTKELVWFEKSGHEPFADEPAKFNRVMVERVRPVVDQSRQLGNEALALPRAGSTLGQASQAGQAST